MTERGQRREADGDDASLAATLRRAIALLASDPAAAEALARQVLAARPADADAATALAAALRSRGEAAEAAAVLAPLIDRHPQAWALQFERARTLVALGRSREAVAPLQLATRRNPRLAAAWRLLGDIQLVAGDVRAAQAAYDQLLCAALPDPRLAEAAAAFCAGRLAGAEQSLRALIAADPRAAPALHLLAETLARRGESAGAEALLAQCLARAPALRLARQAYALVLRRNGRLLAALAELDRLLAQDPADVRGRAAKAALLVEIGDFAGAAPITEALAAEFPDQAHAWTIHGNTLRSLGRTREAVAAWMSAMRLAPERGEPYWSLANLKTYRFSEQERAAMAAQAGRSDLDVEARSLFAFALAKAEEDAGRFADAFARYAEANALTRQHRRYDPASTTALVTRSEALFTPAFFDARRGWGDASNAPVFIVGLPRSGSTLVEQILTSHPAIEPTGELMDIQAMADWVAAQGLADYPGEIARLPREAVAQLGHDYLARTLPRRRLGRALFLDKAPWNWLHIGLIQLILPNARIVDVRRHPLACCASAFKQHFAGGFDFAYDLGDLGRYYADYARLTAHFAAAAPGRVHRVTYERLVNDTEAEVRQLVAYLGLPFDPATLRFFENPRAVATPSSEQVRRPIFTDALDEWRNFEPWLGPLKQALGPALDAYPSPP